MSAQEPCILLYLSVDVCSGAVHTFIPFRAIAAGNGHPSEEQRLMLQRYVRANILDPSHLWGDGAVLGDKKRIIKVILCCDLSSYCHIC
jgi:hypothetical protein